jgi:hypothetical protein
MPGVGDGDATAVESEEAVLEHRPVVVAEKPQTQFDRQVRADAQDVPVEGGVVEGADRQPIGHAGLATRVTIRQDVGGGQELASCDILLTPDVIDCGGIDAFPSPPDRLDFSCGRPVANRCTAPGFMDTGLMVTGWWAG